MTVLVTLATIAPEHVEAVEDAGRRLFAAVDAAGPADFRYAVCRLPDGTYLTLLEVPDSGNPLTALPEYHDFVTGLKGWLAAPTTGGPATVIGSYRVLGPA